MLHRQTCKQTNLTQKSEVNVTTTKSGSAVIWSQEIPFPKAWLLDKSQHPLDVSKEPLPSKKKPSPYLWRKEPLALPHRLPVQPVNISRAMSSSRLLQSPLTSTCFTYTSIPPPQCTGSPSSQTSGSTPLPLLSAFLILV